MAIVVISDGDALEYHGIKHFRVKDDRVSGNAKRQVEWLELCTCFARNQRVTAD